MGENAFHMVFQERWVFSHSSPNPALAATRLWAGYGELVGENSISPGKPCEMHIVTHPGKQTSVTHPGKQTRVINLFVKLGVPARVSLSSPTCRTCYNSQMETSSCIN